MKQSTKFSCYRASRSSFRAMGQHGPVHLSWRASREGQIGDFGEAQRVADAQERPRRQTAPVSFIMLACRRSVGPICDRD